MKTFSLSRHSKLFSVPHNEVDYLFVGSGIHPYHEEPYRAESYAIAYIKEGAVKLNAGLTNNCTLNRYTRAIGDPIFYKKQ